jgi:hypothetical protein
MSNFPRFDRVIRNQRRMMFLSRFVTAAFFIGALGVASTLTGCAGGSEPDEPTVAAPGTPLPAADPFEALRAEVLAVMPDARFEVEDEYGARGEVITTTVWARGTLIDDHMGLRATGEPTTLRFLIVTRHDGAGRIVEAHRYVALRGRLALE